MDDITDDNYSQEIKAIKKLESKEFDSDDDDGDREKHANIADDVADLEFSEAFTATKKIYKDYDFSESRMRDIMSHAEYTALVTSRITMLENGTLPAVKLDSGSQDPTTIAMAEIAHGVSQLSIKRSDPYTGAGCVVSCDDFIYYPSDVFGTLDELRLASTKN